MALDFALGDALAVHYNIEIEGYPLSHFQDVTGLDLSVNVIEHKIMIAGMPYIKKTRGAAKAGQITVQRGMTDDTTFHDWYTQTHGAMAQAMPAARKLVHIMLLDTELAEVVRFTFHGCWPSEWKVSGTTAAGTSPIQETLTIAHEGLLWNS